MSNKRVPTVKPLLVNPNLKNPKHAAVLSDHGINYELPLNPIEVATRRAERILQEKNKNTQEIALVIFYFFIYIYSCNLISTHFYQAHISMS